MWGFDLIYIWDGVYVLHALYCDRYCVNLDATCLISLCSYGDEFFSLIT